MIDVDKVIAVAERAIYISAGKEQLFTADEIKALASMLREAEKDAARYRWLRDVGRHEYDVDDFFDGSSDSVDGKIDQAMKEKCDEREDA